MGFPQSLDIVDHVQHLKGEVYVFGHHIEELEQQLIGGPNLGDQSLVNSLHEVPDGFEDLLVSLLCV